MHSALTPRDGITHDERRRHVRHKLKLSPTIVVELGPNNGGNLIDISGGGLSLQAVAELNPALELELHFRLQGMDWPLELAGRVSWLGPTQKVAGISFKNLPISTEQRIVEWIASQDRPALNDLASEPDDSPLPLFPVALYRLNPPERLVFPPDKFLQSPKAESKPLVDPLKLSTHAGSLPSKPLVLPKSFWNSPSAVVSSAGDRVFVAPEPSRSKSRGHRRRFAITVATSVVGILALIVMIASLNKPGNGAGTTSSQSFSWTDRLRAFFGMEVPKKMDPAKAGVQVWTVQRNGYYYCSDDPDFKTLLPGVIMTQGDAIQSGYQPRVDYCQ